ncbi:hypothetical protein HK097_006205, partial [Rhizophlyctis rosea]
MPLPVHNTRHLRPPPSQPLLPRNSLPTQPDDSLPRLLFTARRAFCRKEFWSEVVALDRLRYKNTNQHRGSLHFRKLLEVKRLLKRLEENAPDAVIDELLDLMHPQRTKKLTGPWTFVPQQPQLCYCLGRLIGCYALLDQLTKSTTTAYTYFQSMTSQTLFMAFGLTTMSSLARLHFLTEKMMTELALCYDVLWKLKHVLPVSKEGMPSYAEDLPADLNLEYLRRVLGGMESNRVLADS